MLIVDAIASVFVEIVDAESVDPASVFDVIVFDVIVFDVIVFDVIVETDRVEKVSDCALIVDTVSNVTASVLVEIVDPISVE